MRISQSFSSLIKAAIDGVYVHEFFGDAVTESGYNKRLRAVIQNLLLDFATDMRDEGHDQEIVEDGMEIVTRDVRKQISRSAFIGDVRELMKRSRGCELPGTFNPLIIGDLFYRQSRPWRGLVERYCKKILEATRLSMELILVHSADEATMDGLLREIIDPAMERYTETLEAKISEIMRQHQRGHPITYNHYFTETVQKARQDHAEKDQARRLNLFFGLKPDAGSSYINPSLPFETGKLLNAINQRDEQDMDRYACSEAIDCMQAYYKVRVFHRVSVTIFTMPYSNEGLMILLGGMVDLTCATGRHESPYRRFCHLRD